MEEYAFYCDIWEYRCNIFYKQKKWGESNLSWSQFISASQFLIKTIVYFHLFASNIFIWITIVRQQYMNYDLIFFSEYTVVPEVFLYPAIFISSNMMMIRLYHKIIINNSFRNQDFNQNVFCNIRPFWDWLDSVGTWYLMFSKIIEIALNSFYDIFMK